MRSDGNEVDRKEKIEYMKNSDLLILGIACCCATLAPWARAQKPLSFKGTSYIQLLSETEAEGFPSSADSLHVNFSRNRYQWVSDLQRAGLIDRSLPRPYRVAVPLMSFGDAGPKVKLTYARNMPGNPGTKGVLLFITMEIP
jgi:hypothetical protein